MSVAQMVTHCKRAADLSIIPREDVMEAAEKQKCNLGYVPETSHVSALLSPVDQSVGRDAVVMKAFHQSQFIQFKGEAVFSQKTSMFGP